MKGPCRCDCSLPPFHPFFLGEERQGPSQVFTGVTSQKDECHARRMGLWQGTEPSFHPSHWKEAAESRAATGGVGAGFYELLHNQELLSKRFPHLTHTVPAAS